MKCITLSSACLAAVLLAPGSVAQDTYQGQIKPVAGPPTYIGVYNVVTGEITQPDPGDGDTTVYDNTAFLGSFFTPGPGVSNMDWGTLSAGGNNFITRMQIGYATSAPGPISIIVGLHEGATGFADPGNPITSFQVDGLPGSESGNPEGFSFDLDLEDAELSLLLPDGPIGYSYEFFDSDSGPLLVGPPNEAGVVDAFDQYTNAFGTYIGTFFFGGDPLASFWCQLGGQAAAPSAVCYLMLGVNEIFGQFPGDPDDVLLLQPLMFLPVTIETMPTFNVPNLPELAGAELRWQVYMKNPGVFPDDPKQLSNGIITVLGDPTLPAAYGPASTIDLVPNQPALLGGVIDMSFTIDGL